jgi:hypothetical protein
MTLGESYRYVRQTCPVGALPFFGLAVKARLSGDRVEMRRCALAGVRMLRWLRPGRYPFVSVGDQLPLL